eukprot:scaffold1895_cov123-Isochrysis_galbana.AAC.5
MDSVSHYLGEIGVWEYDCDCVVGRCRAVGPTTPVACIGIGAYPTFGWIGFVALAGGDIKVDRGLSFGGGRRINASWVVHDVILGVLLLAFGLISDLSDQVRTSSGKLTFRLPGGFTSRIPSPPFVWRADVSGVQTLVWLPVQH